MHHFNKVSIPFIRESFKNRGISDDTQAILLSSWRESTKKQYRTYIGKWMSFCCNREINVFEADVNNVLSFLTVLYKSGLGHSCINTARSALSSFIELNIIIYSAQQCKYWFTSVRT